MSVSLTPSTQLEFKRPLTLLVKQALQVTNSNSQPVAFKVKTTAPKQYCVRPNSGRIEPGETVEVSVLLQPMKEDPPLSSKCRDKFLVQSIAITPDREGLPLPELWTAVEKQDKDSGQASSIHEQKIRCVYLSADSTPQVEAGTDRAASASAAGEADRTMSGAGGDESVLHPAEEHLDLPASTPSATPSVLASSAATVPPPSSTLSTNGTPSNPSPAPSTPPLLPPTSTSTTTVAPSTSDAELQNLRNELTKAQNEISRLGKALKEAEADKGLRLRSSAAEKQKAGVVAGGDILLDVKRQEAEAGVPVKIVVGIVVAVFVCTWLFF